MASRGADSDGRRRRATGGETGGSHPGRTASVAAQLEHLRTIEVAAAVISRWATRLDAILVKRLHRDHPVLLDLIDEVERTGRIPPVREGSFNGYGHQPQQLRAELEAAGLVVDSLVGLEGLAWALDDLDERLDDPADRAVVLDTLRALESVPDLLGASPHLLATARRPA